MSDPERIADLEAQIERQKTGACEVELLMQEQDRKIAALEREIKLLKGGLVIGGNFERYRSVGIW